jgi:hypothetical protein
MEEKRVSVKLTKLRRRVPVKETAHCVEEVVAGLCSIEKRELAMSPVRLTESEVKEVPTTSIVELSIVLPLNATVEVDELSAKAKRDAGRVLNVTLIGAENSLFDNSRT